MRRERSGIYAGVSRNSLKPGPVHVLCALIFPKSQALPCALYMLAAAWNVHWGTQGSSSVHSLCSTVQAFLIPQQDPFHKLPIRVVWGTLPVDTGNYLDPLDRGSLVFDPEFDVSQPASQVEWPNRVACLQRALTTLFSLWLFRSMFFKNSAGRVHDFLWVP